MEGTLLSGPEFGPGGYLPPKAAKRARKIVLREQMGFGWPLAAVATALLVAVAGGVYLYTSSRGPTDPFRPVQPLTSVPVAGAATLVVEGASDPGASVLVVRAGGTVRAFRPDQDVAWCPQSQRLESEDSAWTVDGRLVHGPGESLQPVRSVVYDGVVYADLETQLPPPPSGPPGPAPVCGGGTPD